VPVADSAAPIHDANGHVTGAIVVFRDVSKEYELDRAKTEFVSLASHQLRTPLSAINWYGELLLDGDAGKLNKTQHEYLVEIFEGNQRMIELVDSLLDVSRLEVGKLPTKPQDTSMGELVDSLEKELITSIKNKNLDFNKSVAELPPVNADPKQLRMVVQNLMSNAVKYTPAKGSVHVTLRKATAADVKGAGLRGDGPFAFFSVKDSGYGIPKVQQSKIFGKLFRADNVRALDVEGTGLGLYIVKEVVEKMGGRVWFDSVESVGSTFFVILPFKTRGGR
jgi:signal transduction histidine kinase